MGNNLPPVNVTKWYQPQGKGYISTSNEGTLNTLSGNTLTTLAGNNLVIDGLTYSPKYITNWIKSTKQLTSWRPLSGNGYVDGMGSVAFVDNLGNLIVDNLGNSLVTNSTYVQPKNVTVWTASAS